MPVNVTTFSITTQNESPKMHGFLDVFRWNKLNLRTVCIIQYLCILYNTPKFTKNVRLKKAQNLRTSLNHRSRASYSQAEGVVKYKREAIIPTGRVSWSFKYFHAHGFSCAFVGRCCPRSCFYLLIGLPCSRGFLISLAWGTSRDFIYLGLRVRFTHARTRVG